MHSIYTALVRDKKSGVYSIRRTKEYPNMKLYADDLRGNGFRVAKIFVGYVSDDEVSYWKLDNLKY